MIEPVMPILICLICGMCVCLQLLLEYDDVSWEQREWSTVHQPGAFHIFLVENDLCWAPFEKVPAGSSTGLFPALVMTMIFFDGFFFVVVVYFEFLQLQFGIYFPPFSYLTTKKNETNEVWQFNLC